MNNNISSCVQIIGIVFLLFVSGIIPSYVCESSLGKTILIDDDAIDDPSNFTWNTISKGLKNAEPGDTIKIYNGTYNEQMTIDTKTLELIGQSCDLFGDDENGVLIQGSGNQDVITIKSTGITVDNLIIKQSGTEKSGINIESDFTIIKDNIIKAGSYGISLSEVEDISIKDNNIINFSKIAIQLSNCDEISISNNQILGFDNYGESGIKCEQSTNVLVDYNKIFTDNSGVGIELFHLSKQNNIINNQIENNTWGIKLWWNANDNKITGNIITNSTDDGLFIDFTTSVQSSNLKITNNRILNSNNYGLYLFHIRGASIEHNVIDDSSNDGVYCEWSNYSMFSNNKFTNNDDGIVQVKCTGNTFQENNISNNDEGIYVSSSKNTEIFNNEFWKNTNAIMIEESTFSKIIGNNLIDNFDAVSLLTQSDENIISNNHIFNSSRYGCHLTFAKENVVNENIFEDNEDFAIYVEVKSDGNTFYHNIFLNNTNHAGDSCCNRWDDGQCGNYWDDYNGKDNCHGPGQDEDGSDGIGDIPYNISLGTNKDNYPLMTKEGWKKPVLSCNGAISWGYVRPGSIQHDSFKIENIGTSESHLDWNITNLPDWGEWTITPKNGKNLTPEEGKQKITVSVIVPNQSVKSYSGNITVENINDGNICQIPISLSTPKNKQVWIESFLEYIINFNFCSIGFFNHLRENFM